MGESVLGGSCSNKPYFPKHYHIEIQEIRNGFIVKFGDDIMYSSDFSGVEEAVLELYNVIRIHRNNVEGNFAKMQGGQSVGLGAVTNR